MFTTLVAWSDRHVICDQNLLLDNVLSEFFRVVYDINVVSPHERHSLVLDSGGER